MKFRYVGDHSDMQAYGYDFRDEATPDVIDEIAIKRLSGNRFFEAVDEGDEELTSPEEKKKPGRKPKAAATE